MTAEGDLSEAVDERLDRLVELSRLRAESRRAVRERMGRRRAYGLAERHRTKLERQETGSE